MEVNFSTYPSFEEVKKKFKAEEKVSWRKCWTTHEIIRHSDPKYDEVMQKHVKKLDDLWLELISIKLLKTARGLMPFGGEEKINKFALLLAKGRINEADDFKKSIRK